MPLSEMLGGGRRGRLAVLRFVATAGLGGMGTMHGSIAMKMRNVCQLEPSVSESSELLTRPRCPRRRTNLNRLVLTPTLTPLRPRPRPITRRRAPHPTSHRTLTSVRLTLPPLPLSFQPLLLLHVRPRPRQVILHILRIILRSEPRARSPVVEVFTTDAGCAEIFS